MAEVVRSRIEDGIGVLTLADVERGNVLSPALVAEAQAVHREFVDAGVRVAVLDAEGEAFCSGRDPLATRIPGEPPAGAIFIDEMEQSPIAWVAAVDGEVLGAGINLVATAMHVVSGPRTRFRVPELLDGLHPRPVAEELTRLIGARRTAALLVTGDPMPVDEARASGLVSEVVGPAEVGARARLRAEALAGLAPEVLRAARAGWRARFAPAPAV